MVLETIYELDFLYCPYGFRPGRSAHQALQVLRTGFVSHGLCWVIDLDIENDLYAASYCPQLMRSDRID
jgi:RNA-directed DNA polymerase